MSLVEREVTSARVAASQANGKKSKGSTTPEGKARASLNSLKTGAYAKTDNVMRQIMLRRGEDPAFYDQLHHDLTEGWQPDDVMQAMAVKSIADKSFDKASLRAAWMESQLTALQVGKIQEQRRQLRARRWLPGTPIDKPEAQGLWLEKDRPNKFKRIFDILDCLQEWFEARVCPDEYPTVMDELYGECHSQAGEKIRLSFMDLFSDDQEATARAIQELPQWIAQERRDVEQERDLYRQEMALRNSAGPTLTEEQVMRKEAALERQISEQSRLLLQMKLQRTKWWREEGTGNREQGRSSKEPGETTIAARPNSGNREQGETAVPTGPNAVSPASNDASSSGAESSSTIAPSAETVPVKAPMRAERPDGGEAASLDAEKGQSNLVSAA